MLPLCMIHNATLKFDCLQVLNFRRALRNPVLTVWHALFGATRSTIFLSTFVASYMGTISLHRKFFKGDFKLLYWLAGKTYLGRSYGKITMVL